MIRVLMTVSTNLGHNGISTVAVNYALHLPVDRIQVDFVTSGIPPEDLSETLTAAGCHIHVLPSRLRHPVRYAKALGRILRENHYDIVHAHGNSATLAMETVLAQRAGIAVRIAHSHNTTCRFKFLHRVLWKRFQTSLTHRIACGKDAGSWLFGTRPFTVFANGSDLTKLRYQPDARKRLRSEMGAEKDDFLVLHVGLFNEQKNQMYLLDAFRALLAIRPESRLVLLGEGPMRDTLLERIRALDIENRVIMPGFVTNVSDYISACDTAALPSLYEGFPNVVVEFQACGIPVFASDKITPDVNITGDVRFLPLSPDPGVWARALRSVSFSDRDAVSLRNCAWLADAGYDIVRNAGLLADYYESACNVKRK